MQEELYYILNINQIKKISTFHKIVKKNCALQFLTCEKFNAQCILRGEDALVNASPGVKMH